MKIYGTLKVAAGLLVMSAVTICLSNGEISDHGNDTIEPSTAATVATEAWSRTTNSVNDSDVIVDPNVKLCQGYDSVGYVNGAVGPVYNAHPGTAAVPAPPAFGGTAAVSAPPVYEGGGEVVYEGSSGCATCGVSGCDGGCSVGYDNGTAGLPSKFIYGVDGATCSKFGHEPAWRNQKMVPWEQFAYGEYIGPHRTPHVGEYRVRVNDNIEFVYMLTREQSVDPYQLYVGDEIQISSAIDASLNQREITVLSDGTVSLSLIGQVRVAGKTVADLQRELNDKYSAYVKTPAIVVGVTKGDTPLQDVRDAVDARQGQGGQIRQAIVSPDGTLQLPLIGSVPVVGLTLEEIRREVNARYRTRVKGIEVTPILAQRAARFVFVVGEVPQPGRFEMTGPTTVMQALALAEGFNASGNVRQVIVFRRDQNWQLIATRLDLAGALYGRRPRPSDDLWLRDSDIVLVPKKPIQRFSEAVNLYLTQSLYAVFPQQGVAFNFDDFQSL